MKKTEAVEREAPSLYCEKCRRWIETQEQHNMFATVDGVAQPLTVWHCPECRGEQGAAVKVSHGPVTGADLSKEERLGPYRDVAAVIKVNASGKTQRVTLKDCAHEACVAVGAKGVRCRVCAKASRKAAA